MGNLCSALWLAKHVTKINLFDSHDNRMRYYYCFHWEYEESEGTYPRLPNYYMKMCEQNPGYAWSRQALVQLYKLSLILECSIATSLQVENNEHFDDNISWRIWQDAVTLSQNPVVFSESQSWNRSQKPKKLSSLLNPFKWDWSAKYNLCLNPQIFFLAGRKNPLSKHRKIKLRILNQWGKVLINVEVASKQV